MGKSKLSNMESWTEIGSDHGHDQQVQIRRIVDEHVSWLLAWHRCAFLSTGVAGEAAKNAYELPQPKAFAAWFKNAAQKLTTEQTSIDRLAVLHDQLHKLAKMVLLKADGKPLLPTDYEMVITRFADFMQSLRNFECLFAAAAAGLDTLTGLRSRYGLHADLSAELKRLERSEQPFCIAIGCIDDYKNIPNLHGTETAERALVQVADCIAKTLRPYDDAYRLGGATFLICLKNTNDVEADKALQRLQASIDAAPLRLFGGGTMPLSISFGVVQAAAKSEPCTLLRDAEEAVHEAQANGARQIRTGKTLATA